MHSVHILRGLHKNYTVVAGQGRRSPTRRERLFNEYLVCIGPLHLSGSTGDSNAQVDGNSRVRISVKEKTCFIFVSLCPGKRESVSKQDPMKAGELRES